MYGMQHNATTQDLCAGRFKTLFTYLVVEGQDYLAALVNDVGLSAWQQAQQITLDAKGLAQELALVGQQGER